ncbi:family 16 glycosylhydrolase [Flavobacterium sp.]|jgi:beta-glucanase (GH16 family)|uniref:family 16 glycosylhydrolase n=1 Tax=Flavobacterium sp. TaxID=239 RepID=UPI0037C02751
MKKNTCFHLFIFLFLVVQNSFAQVDVVYNNLVWSDEFETNGAVNSTKWHHQTQLPAGGSWFNGEQQHYTNLITNSFVNTGFLNIKAIKEPYTNQGVTKQYTSARLNSKFAFMYGRVDVRAKIPTNQGTWPAIWLLGKNVNEDGGFFDSQFGTTSWPACGEIDIMEHGITQSQPAGYVQSAIHTPSSFGNTVNHGGTIASNLGNDFHVYSMNWSPFQITFLLDGVAFYTYNPAVKNASTWPFNAEQYLLLNIAMGGVAGTIPSSFTNAAMEIDYVRVYQNTTPDTESPANFTATSGVIGSSSIELLVNATDNSGSVIYNVTYGTTTLSFAGLSGVQKSAVIPGLTPNTNYTFTISATDAAGNAFVNNPVVVNATTAVASQCNGTNNEAQQGSFTVGYNYEFETIGTDVKITFEILDPNLVGVVAILWNQNPFTETQMTNVSGNKFTKTITGQTIGATINYAVKFAYAGGLAVTKYFPYVVGDNCDLGTPTTKFDNDLTFINPAKDFLEIQSEIPIDRIEIYNMTGILALTATEISDKIDISRLPAGIYILNIYSGNERNVRKLIVK